MAVTPLDILQHQFGAARRGGYEPTEVHAFLDTVREALEASLRENLKLREALLERDREVAGLRGESGEIKEALVLARRLAVDMDNHARREADIIVGEARLEAEQILAATRDEERLLQEHLMRLRTSRTHHLSQMRAFIHAQGRILDELDRE
ncbi:MAG: DivIVA domain-containing protein [Myxococcales bacterium]|nr:DivIVA domain-containing protein [Myxococcales bacterium]